MLCNHGRGDHGGGDHDGDRGGDCGGVEMEKMMKQIMAEEQIAEAK